MSLVERFAAALTQNAPEDEQAQPAREALVDLLVWTMFVDRHLSLAEHEKLDELTDGLTWTATIGLPEFFGESVARAREAIESEESGAAYLATITDRLGERETRRQAIVASEQMMGADGKLTPEEVAHLLAVSKAFGLRD